LSKKQSSRVFLAAVAELLPKLPASPIREIIASILRSAAYNEKDLENLARIYFAEGYLGLRPSGNVPLKGLLKQRPDLIDPVNDEGLFPEDFFDPARDLGFYRTMASAVRKQIHDPQTAEEAVVNMLIGLTPAGLKETKPLFFAIGEKLAEQKVDPGKVRAAIFSFATKRARDYADLKKQPTDRPSDLDDKGFSQINMQKIFDLMEASFDTVGGQEIMATIRDKVMRNLRSPGQKKVWSMILENPDLIGKKITNAKAGELAEAINAGVAEDEQISQQRAGQIWRDVLDIARKTVDSDPKLFAQLQDIIFKRKSLDPMGIGRLARLRRMALQALRKQGSRR